MRLNRGRERGQVGMTVLLIMVVMVTIAVAVASRSVTNLNLTRLEQESTRSLDLAESGIDEILNLISQDATKIGSNFRARIQEKDVFVSTSRLTSIDSLPVDEGHTIEIALAPATTTMRIQWGDGSECTDPDNVAAIEVTFIKEDSANYYAKRQAFDRCDRANGLEIDNDYDVTITDVNKDGSSDLGEYQVARIKVLYATTNLTVTGTGLPDQGIKATATASDSEETTTTVAKYQYRGSLPSIFDYVVFSGTTIQ